MAIEYRSHYFDNPKAKAAFERYAINIFGLDFSLWEAKGLWDPNYIPFSAFDGNECIATICVYPSDMIIENTPSRGAQLLTVGTRNEYRRRGVQRKIWHEAQNWINQNADFTFLFTDNEVAPFYERLGFKRKRESYTRIPLRTLSQTTSPANPAHQHRQLPLRQLNLDSEDDYRIITRLAASREMVSNRIGFRNPNLLLFMFLYCYREWTFYSEMFDLIIVIEHSDGVLRLHDIVADRMPSFAEIRPLLSQFNSPQVDFLFCTDRLSPPAGTQKPVSDSVLIVCDRFDLTGDFVFPNSIRA